MAASRPRSRPVRSKRCLLRLDGLDVSAVAVCLLNSYVNPAHELMLAEYIWRVPVRR